MRQQYAWRSLLLNGFLAFVATLVVLQMVRIQVSAEAEAFRAQADAFKGGYKTFYPERGEIYDRNGHLLAGNQTVYEVGVDLTTVIDPHSVAMAVSVNLGKDYNEVYSEILNPPPGLSYLVVDNFASSEAVTYFKGTQDRTEQFRKPNSQPGRPGIQSALGTQLSRRRTGIGCDWVCQP